MSYLTPEALRAKAQQIGVERDLLDLRAEELRAEADRLEAATRTPGQVAAEAFASDYRDPSYVMSDGEIRRWSEVAAAVIDHVVGPDRAVVPIALLAEYRPSMDAEVLHSWAVDVLHRAKSLS